MVVTRGLLENIVLWLLGRGPRESVEELPWGSVAVKDLAAERRKLMEEIGRLRAEKKKLEEEVNKTLAELEELRARLGGGCRGALWTLLLLVAGATTGPGAVALAARGC